MFERRIFAGPSSGMTSSFDVVELASPPPFSLFFLFFLLLPPDLPMMTGLLSRFDYVDSIDSQSHGFLDVTEK